MCLSIQLNVNCQLQSVWYWYRQILKNHNRFIIFKLPSYTTSVDLPHCTILKWVLRRHYRTISGLNFRMKLRPVKRLCTLRTSRIFSKERRSWVKFKSQNPIAKGEEKCRKVDSPNHLKNCQIKSAINRLSIAKMRIAKCQLWKFGNFLSNRRMNVKGHPVKH